MIVSGKVLWSDGGTPARDAEVIITATKDGKAAGTGKTDDAGKFKIDVANGTYHLAVTHADADKAEPIEITVPGDGLLDLSLELTKARDAAEPEQETVSGKVVWFGRHTPIEGAKVIIHQPGETKGASATTGKDGHFDIATTVSDTSQITIKHLDGHQIEPESLKQEGSRPTYTLAGYGGTIDQNVGRVFFGFLCVLLLLLILWWLNAVADEESRGDASVLLYQINQADALVLETATVEKEETKALSAIDADTAIKADEKEKKKADVVADTQARYTAVLSSLNRLYDRIGNRLQPRDVSVDDNATRAELTGTVEKLQASIAAIKQPDSTAMAGLRSSAPAEHRKILDKLAQLAKGDLARGGIATEGMNLMVSDNVSVTVLFWAFVGTLVRLIMTVQYYLFKSSFYRQGLFQHFGLLFAVPVLTLAMIKLLSLVRISAESGGADALALDMSDPQVMAVAAFLLALGPWKLWSRLQTLSQSVGSR